MPSCPVNSIWSAKQVCSLLRLIVLVSATATAGGCRFWHGFDPPPNRTGEDGPAIRAPHEQRSVVLDYFEDPTSSPLRNMTGRRNGNGIGAGMTRRLQETMLNQGYSNVIIDTKLAAKARELINLLPSARREAMAKLRESYPEVDVIVTGRVTDFTRSRDKPKETREKYLFTKPSTVVAIRLDLFDLDLGRVVSHDHVIGTAWDYGGRDTAEIYGDLTFDEYLFWTTSLGHAAHEATLETMNIIGRLSPKRQAATGIVEQIDSRTVRIAGSSSASYRKGQRYYLRQDGEPIWDRHLQNRSIRVLISEVSGTSFTGYLSGEPEAGVEILGAVLSVAPPTENDRERRKGAGGPGSPAAESPPEAEQNPS